MDLLLVKAGRTEWDESRRLMGTLAIPLSEEGVREVRQAFGDAADLDAQEVCSSFSLCALQTARILARRIDKPLRRIEGLEEVDLGMWQGLLEGELKRRHRRTWAVWCRSPLEVLPPRGEWLQDAYGRLVETLEGLFLHYGKEGAVAVVVPPMAHQLLLCYLKDVGPGNFWEQNTRGFRWERFKV